MFKNSFKKISKSKKGAGFTLIEFLLYIGIFAIVLIVTLQMFGSVFEAHLESQANSDVGADGRFILNRFNYDMNRAQSISTPASAGSTSTTLSIQVDGNTLTYSLNNNNLILQNSGTNSSDQLNSEGTDVSEVSFLRLAGGDSKDVIQLSFTLTSKVVRRTKKEVMDFQTTGGLR